MFNEITGSLDSFSGPCLLIGDFNEVLNSEDKKGHIRVTSSMEQFRSFINDNHLRPMEMFGRKYTWDRDVSRSRINWALCQPDWLSKFHAMKLTCLPKLFFDYIPLYL